jgi:hypothetical protein
MDYADWFAWLVLSLDAMALSIALGWYLAGEIRRKVPFRPNLSRDPGIFDPHVRINGRWVPLDLSTDDRPLSLKQRAWFGPRR